MGQQQLALCEANKSWNLFVNDTICPNEGLFVYRSVPSCVTNLLYGRYIMLKGFLSAMEDVFL